MMHLDRRRYLSMECELVTANGCDHRKAPAAVRRELAGRLVDIYSRKLARLKRFAAA
jgi:hypothetical protein